MLYRISMTERGLTGIANIFRSGLSGLDDLLRAGTVPFNLNVAKYVSQATLKKNILKIRCQAPSYSYPLWVAESYRSRNTCCHRVVCSNPKGFENY